MITLAGKFALELARLEDTVSSRSPRALQLRFTHVRGTFAFTVLVPVGVGHEHALSRALLSPGGPLQLPVGELDGVIAGFPADFEGLLHVPLLDLERVVSVDGQARRRKLGSSMKQDLVGTFQPDSSV